MKKILLFLMIIISLFTGCSKAPPSFIDPQWTKSPSKVTVLYTEPIVENKDDLEDDLAEHKDNFGQWFGEQFKASFDRFTK